MRRYLWLLMTVTAMAYLLAMTLNAVVDPYGVLGAPRVDGFNAQKPFLGRQIRLYFASDILRDDYDALVVGASTADGIPARHPSWGGDRVYVLAVGGANVYEMYRYIQHATATHRIRRIVIALDFFSFNGYRRPTDDFREEVLAVTSDGRSNPAARIERLKWIVSVDGLYDSVRTVWYQQRAGSANERPRHPREIFGRIEQTFVERVYLPPPHYRFSLDASPFGPGPMTVLDDILAWARSNAIAVDMFVTPSHARALAVVDAVGLWPQFDDWKRRLAARHRPDARVRVWDFSGISAETTEPVPDLAIEGARLTNYRDPIHFEPALGARVLERIAGANSGFGAELTPESVESHLADFRRRFVRWAESVPADIAEISGYVRAAGRAGRESDHSAQPRRGNSPRE